VLPHRDEHRASAYHCPGLRAGSGSPSQRNAVRIEIPQRDDPFTQSESFAPRPNPRRRGFGTEFVRHLTALRGGGNVIGSGC
jgi:hypothetical protein